MKFFLSLEKVAIAIVLIMQTACVIATKPNPSEKTFFSVWKAIDGSSTVNLTSANQGGGNFSAVYSFPDGSSATCIVNARLTDGRYNVSSGSYNVVSCSAATGLNAQAFVNTAAGSGTYSQNSGNLILCKTSSNVCYSYQ